MEDTNIHCEFKQFDIVSDISDHHLRHLRYYSSSKKRDRENCFTKAESSVHRRIMKEWRILQDNLPDSIFVRVSETRIDLLRAAVVGVAGTPYHDGLFFFDILFSPKFPTQPPLVHYCSFGYSLNPILHNNGLVCLSLLNTWDGESCERWIPAESTVLQVLISLQSLVLNEKPYYNNPSLLRPGRNSIEYNEEVFVVTCKSTLQLIRNPPGNFESLVRWHFGRRANAILMACQQYANGRATGGFYGSDPTVKVSKKLQTAIATVYPLMVVAFRGIGATLMKGVEVLRLEEEEERKKEKEKSEGVLKKVITKIRGILGLQSKNKRRVLRV